MAKKVINAFNGGEVSPNLYARTDNELYNKSCIKMENFLPLEYGGASRRPASSYLAELGSKNVFIPFEVKGNENYILSFSNNSLFILDVDGTQEAQFSTTILEAELYNIHYVQSNDVIFISHPNHPVFQISKTVDGWQYDELEFKIPPLLDLDKSGVTITSSSYQNETILTASADYFNSEHEGAYFRFRSPRTFLHTDYTGAGAVNVAGASTSSVSETFAQNAVNYVTEAINCSTVNFTVETEGEWNGKVILQRSFDNGNSFKDYVIIGDLHSAVAAQDAQQRQFVFSSTEPEPNNSLLRIKYIPSTKYALTASIRVNDPYFYALCKVTEYVSPTQVKADVKSVFQYEISEFNEWNTTENYEKGDRVKLTEAFVNEDYNPSDTSINFRNKSNVVNVQSHETNWDTLVTEYFVPNSGDSVRETQIVDICYGNGALWILDRSVQVHKLRFDTSGSYEFVYDGIIFNAQSDFPTTSIHSLNLSSGRAYGDNKQTRMRAVSLDYCGRSEHSNFPIAILGITQNNGKREPYSNAQSNLTPVVDINVCTAFAVYLYSETGTKKTGTNSSYSRNVNEQYPYPYKHMYIPKGISFGRDIFIEYVIIEAVNDYPDYYLKIRNVTNMRKVDENFKNMNQQLKTYDTVDSISGVNWRAISGSTPRDQSYEDSKSFITIKNYVGTAANNYDINNNYSSSMFVTNITETDAAQFRDPLNQFDISNQIISNTQVAGIYYVRNDTNNTSRNDFMYMLRSDGELFKYAIAGTTRYYRYLENHNADTDTLAQLDIKGVVVEEYPEMNEFYEGAFSDYRGHPESIAIHENRLCFGGTKTTPNTVWLSNTDDFNNFNLGVLTTDALKLTFNALKQNEIKWMCSGRDLFIGTAENEWSLGSGNQSLPVSPTQFNLKRRTSYGSSDIQALLVNSAVLFLQRENKKIREWYLQENQEDYLAQNLAFVAEHITGAGIKQIAVQNQPTTIVWMVREDGKLIGLTYERETETFAWHQHVFDGSVESVCVLPSEGNEDDVYLSISKTDTNIRCLVKLDDIEWGTDYTTEFSGLDFYRKYTGNNKTVLDGLTAFIGKDVTVVDGGNKLPSTYTVSSYNVVISGYQDIIISGYTGSKTSLNGTYTNIGTKNNYVVFSKISTVDTGKQIEYTGSNWALRSYDIVGVPYQLEATVNSTDLNPPTSGWLDYDNSTGTSSPTVATFTESGSKAPLNGTYTPIGKKNNYLVYSTGSTIDTGKQIEYGTSGWLLGRYDVGGVNYLLEADVSSFDVSPPTSGWLDYDNATGISSPTVATYTAVGDGGTITIPSTNNTVYVGFPYTSTLAPLYIDIAYTTGTTLGSKKSIHTASVRFKDTLSAKIGQTETDLEPVKFASTTALNTENVECWLDNANEFLQTVYIVQDEPQPCTILAMIPNVEGV
jgi:hypothetical protein